MRLAILVLISVYGTSARAEVALPAPLSAQDVAALARSRRSELIAARARARAAAERQTLVSALEEPIISVSLDHVPFNLMGLDGSVTVEQTFPLSRVRGNRKRAAEAGARRELANAQRVGLVVELDAVDAFWMLAQLRATAEIATRQSSTLQSSAADGSGARGGVEAVVPAMQPKTRKAIALAVASRHFQFRFDPKPTFRYANEIRRAGFEISS